MKNSFYFPHDTDAKNDQKILMIRSKFNLEGYALHFMVLETLAQDTNGYLNREAIGGLSLSYGVPIKTLENFLTYSISIGLYRENEQGIFSPRMMKHIEMRRVLIDAGKRGAAKRWKNSPPKSPPNAKESKGKEIKGNNNTGDRKKFLEELEKIIEIWNDINFTSKQKNETIKIGEPIMKKCRNITDEILKKYRDLRKKFQPEDFILAIENYTQEIGDRGNDGDYKDHRFYFLEFLKQGNGFIKFLN